MRVVSLFVLLVVVGCVSAFTDVEYRNTFVMWMHEHAKMYTNDEFLARFEIFKTNMDYVRDWNAKGSATVLGLTSLADLSNSEYRSVYLGTRIEVPQVLLSNSAKISAKANATVDWRLKGVVTGIKDQGQCGSCWSFSATGSMEGVHAQATGMLVSLSEQNLMDCSTAYGNLGCNGGLMNSAFQYVIANKGIDTEASYPYMTAQGTCKFSTANIGATISSYSNVASGSETALMTAVNNQPVSVAIDASHNSFQLYKSGTYYEPQCSSSRLDHGVLAIGYGTDDSGNDYWLVKNSWGTSWGMAGYIQMARNKANNCGIATQASFPVV